MILTERTINIIDHESIMDSPVVLYRGDKNVELKLNIKSSRFKFRDDDSLNFIESAQASYGQLIIQTPNQNEPIFSEITATKKGYIIFVITAEMIDEIDEVGKYTFQVRLLDSNKRSRATIPPVVNGIEIREPITSEDSNVLNSAVVGLASAADEEVLDTFDINGNYDKTDWKFGDKITAAKLNKAEDGIYQSYALGLNNSSQIKEKANKSDIAKISSGTPNFESSIENMTDITKNYVNTTDGYLYVYNGSTFEKTTVLYQSTGIANNSVSQRKLEDELKTLFIPYYSDPLTINWIDGYSINYNGSINEFADYKYCKYPVKVGEVYKIKTQRLWSNAGWIILDSNNNVLLTDTIQNSQVSVEEEVEIPDKGAFLCFNNYKGSFSYLSKVKYSLKQSEIEFEYLPTELKDMFELIYNDVTNSLNWINGSYIKKDGTFDTSQDYSYAVIDVAPFMECKITGKRTYAASCYVVKDKLGNVVLEDGADTTTITNFNDVAFTIPANGAKLYINDRSFKSLKLKNKLNLKTNSSLKDTNSSLKDKTILFTGDSICAAAIETSPGVYDGQYGWAEIIKENNPSLTVKNYGQGGTTIAKQDGKTSSILERIDIMYADYPDADYIIIEGGVNDCYATSIDLGTISSGYDGTLDEKTFCGALESLFKKSIVKWKGKKIGYIVTFKVPTADANNFQEYMNKAKEICEKWSIPYIDLYTQSGLEYHVNEIATAYSYGGGGLHPNIEGYKIITPKIENWIKLL